MVAKSCTSWSVVYIVIYRVSNHPFGAGFRNQYESSKSSKFYIDHQWESPISWTMIPSGYVKIAIENGQL